MMEELKKQIAEEEKHLEKVKAELYTTLGRIATLKDVVSKLNEQQGDKNEQKNG